MTEPVDAEPERPGQSLRSLFVGAGAVVVSFLLILVVLVLLTISLYQQALKSDRRDEETAKILLEIRHLQVIYARQNTRREVRSEKAAKSAEKAVARVSKKTDKFAAILKATPGRTVVIRPAPVVIRPRTRARIRRRAVPKKAHAGAATGPHLQRWIGYWDGQKWVGGWK